MVKGDTVDEWRGVVVGAGDGWKEGDEVGGPAHLLAFAVDPEGYKRVHVGDVGRVRVFWRVGRAI